MQVYDSLSGLVEISPWSGLALVTRGIPGSTVPAKGGVFQSGRARSSDRIVCARWRWLRRAEYLKPGGTIVEPMSGNTGSGWRESWRSAVTGALLRCPDKVAQDKISVLRANGAEVVVCPARVAPDHPDSRQCRPPDGRRDTERLAADQYANPETHGSDTTPPRARRSGRRRTGR